MKLPSRLALLLTGVLICGYALPATAQTASTVFLVASDAWVPPADRYLRPKEGQYFFAIRVTVTRDSTNPHLRLTVSSRKFGLIVNQAVVYKPSYFSGSIVPSPCSNIELLSSGSVTCDLVFELPQDIRSGTLEFRDSVFSATPVYTGLH